MKQQEPVTSMRDALAGAGGDFASDFCQWVKANYFTAWRSHRAEPVEYEDAELFPSVRFSATQELLAGSARFTGMVQPLSSQYYRAVRGLDTVAFVVGNVDISAGIGRKSEGVGFELDVRETAPDAGWQTLTNGWAYRFSAAVPNALCLSVLDAGAMLTETLREPWPNPLRLHESARIHFPLPRDLKVNRVQLSIFTPAMLQIFQQDDVPVQLDDMTGAYVAWDINAGVKEVASGVYFYLLNYDGETRLGKFAVIGR
jgi:hypothetical protein